MKSTSNYTEIMSAMSLPVRGAWVEIGALVVDERVDDVAPRAGSVG